MRRLLLRSGSITAYRLNRFLLSSPLRRKSFLLLNTPIQCAGDCSRIFPDRTNPRYSTQSAAAMDETNIDSGAPSSTTKEDGCAATKTKSEKTNEPKELPKLTPSEFRAYNRMAEHMEYFHNHFRHTWEELYTACTNNKRPAGQSIRQFISMGLDFCSHLSTHHSIEEHHIFPLLAKKMPEFRKKEELLKQHRDIHVGMDKLEAYLNDCRRGEADFSLAEMKKLMDSFGAVLWAHLDDEVRTLGAENMRKYWTLEEMRRLPM